jgi:hypothetical protein
MQKVTLGLALHRPELIQLMSGHMQGHEAIILEDPPEGSFNQMLAGLIGVDDYLNQVDIEYPVFSRKMCRMLRELKSQGKEIFQIEPFMEILLGIHEFFADDHSPAELDKQSIQYPVYLAERNATRALVDYYQTVVSGSFDETVRAIIRFARMDAARFKLRDSLRAQEIASMVRKYSTSYVEAGVMHYPLRQLLRLQLQDKVRVKTIFLADEALQSMGQKGHLYSPGDQLTLLYVFHPGIRETRREKVLAARSIVYSRIVAKDEVTENLNQFPHLRDELDCIRTANALSLNDCRWLFPLIRREKSHDARSIVAEYLADKRPRIDMYIQSTKARRTS